MRIVVLSNPISGAGRAAAAGEALAATLRAAGHEVQIAYTQPHPPKGPPLAQWIEPLLESAELLVISGGDGAVRMATPSAVRTHTPIYHLPMGTENLFAREFGMNHEPATLLCAIERLQIKTIDVGIANGEMFTLMASVGFDANVVHDLASCRGKSISHSTYVGPVWRQFRTWSAPCLDVTVDGQQIAASEPGFVVVANSRQYGWRLDPAIKASMFDGLLDVTFFPARSSWNVAAWALKCRLRRQLRDKRLCYVTGKAVEIRCAETCRHQLDGDPPPAPRPHLSAAASDGEGRFRLNIQIQPSALPVLVP